LLEPVPSSALVVAGADPALWWPAFGLIVCGVAGLIVNVVVCWRLWHDPDGTHAYIRHQVERLRQWGLTEELETDQQRQAHDEQRATQVMRHLPWIVPLAAVAAVLALLAGVSIALRWNYRLAQLGCVAAAFNVVGLCCLPGALVGLWGLLLLQSEEGRGHFVH
jgi:Co/Zn/Cd efflux system component